jgi:large-conductance mechanosensitive channel
MIMKCPSKFCEKDNPEDAIYCGNCGLDLRMQKEFVMISDLMFATLRSEMKKLNADNKLKDMDLPTFRYVIKDRPELAFVLGMVLAIEDKKKSKESSEPTVVDIEKEKLKVLKEIRDSLKRK